MKQPDKLDIFLKLFVITIMVLGFIFFFVVAPFVTAWAVPVIVTNNTIYVHTDIEQVTEVNGEPVTDCWRYHEIQYDSKEYIELIGKENDTLKAQMESTQEVLDFLLLG